MRTSEKGFLGDIQRLIIIMMMVLSVLLPIAPQVVWAKDDKVNGDWSSRKVIKTKQAEKELEADLMVRVGDIDNFGFGWGGDYDPFSGEATNAHGLSFKTDKDDPAGTDRIMVISSFKYDEVKNIKGGLTEDFTDGYTREINQKGNKDDNKVKPINLSYKDELIDNKIKVESAILQIFIDDFQPVKFKDYKLEYEVTIDDVRIPELEVMINGLNQHGPIGKLLTFNVPQEYLKYFTDGEVSIKFDVPKEKNKYDTPNKKDTTIWGKKGVYSTGYGDGYAIDFVKLLINPYKLTNEAIIEGEVTDTSNKPIEGATISSGGLEKVKTNESGKYSIKVPAGKAFVTASKIGYESQTIEKDVIVGKVYEGVNFKLSPVKLSRKIKLLEVTDSGNSDIKSDKINKFYDITTMSMKRFVALREELNGKYDMIYIGTGTYSTQGVNVNAKNHNTKNIKNDITHLKTTEIRDNFINKGQLVVLDQNATKPNGGNHDGSILVQYFGKYDVLKNEKNPKGNVIVVNNANKAEQFLEIARNQEYIKIINKRPIIKNLENPESYTGQSSNQYQPGDNIVFKYELADNIRPSDTSLEANLYIDTNYNKQYESSDLVLSVPVTSQHGTLEYVLPPGISGLRFWKLEIVDRNTGLKDYNEGVFKFKGEKAYINVLQVKQKESDVVNLPDVINKVLGIQALKNDDYSIDIQVTDMNTFNNSIHSEINGKYDMLIFGFVDVYNNATISDKAVESVKKFIETGQSVMFTHDTIYGNNNNWVNNFKKETGQTGVEHNLGEGAPNISTSTKRVNDGMILQYPYKLNENITIATTHNQYYTLDLEDSSVIPWYNITGSSRDEDDSWHHYYTYSKGTVTYSGTGHITGDYKGYENAKEELELFVNTMFLAFSGANNAPKIELIKPSLKEDQREITIKHSQSVDVEYIVKDFDLKDSTLKSSKIYVDDELVLENYNVASGSTIKKTIEHSKQPGESFTIKIEATDNSGAKAEKVFVVKIQKYVEFKDNTVSGINSDGYIHPLSYANLKVELSASADMKDTKLVMKIPDKYSNLGISFENKGTIIKLYNTKTKLDTKLEPEQYKIMDNSITVDLGALEGNDKDLVEHTIQIYTKMKPAPHLKINEYNARLETGNDTKMEIESTLSANIEETDFHFVLKPYSLQLIKIPKIN